MTTPNPSRKETIADYRQRQSIPELKRKAEKSICKSRLWTQEEIDLAVARAMETIQLFWY